MPCALEHDHGTRLQARLDLDLLLAVERLDRPRGAEHGLREPQIELADEVEPVAHEARVGSHVDAQVEIAGRGAQLAGVARPVRRTAWPSSMPIGTRPRTYALRPASAAAAVGTGRSGIAAATGAAATGRGAHDLPQRRAHDLADLARALAFGARQDLGAGRRRRRPADLARRTSSRSRSTWRRRRRRRGRSRPRPAHRRPPPGPSRREAAAEERAEQVVQEAEIHELLGVEALAGHALVPVAVVARPPVVVGQHLVGLGDLAEALVGVRRLGDVGMQLAGKPAEGLLDVAIGGVPATPSNS